MPDRVAISTECAADSSTLRNLGWIMPDARDPRKPATLTGSLYPFAAERGQRERLFFDGRSMSRFDSIHPHVCPATSREN